MTEDSGLSIRPSVHPSGCPSREEAQARKRLRVVLLGRFCALIRLCCPGPCHSPTGSPAIAGVKMNLPVGEWSSVFLPSSRRADCSRPHCVTTTSGGQARLEGPSGVCPDSLGKDLRLPWS